MTKTLVYIQYLLVLAGISALSYCVVIFGTARHYQMSAREKLRKSNSKVAAHSPPSKSLVPLAPAILREDSGFEVIAGIDVPRVHLAAMVAEGSTKKVLRVAVGHIPGTALPWEAGNTVLVAHRDTFFRHLGEIRRGDIIRLTVPGEEYIYYVTFIDIVNPDETWVLQSTSGKTLTLITCYPIHLIGPAPQRLVVRARRSD